MGNNFDSVLTCSTEHVTEEKSAADFYIRGFFSSHLLNVVYDLYVTLLLPKPVGSFRDTCA